MTDKKEKDRHIRFLLGIKLQTTYLSDGNIRNMPVVGVGSYQSPAQDKTVTDYVGNKIYKTVNNGTRILDRILIDGGYIKDNQYYYYLTDHLGNNRAVGNAKGEIVQRTEYYPFGMAFSEYGENNFGSEKNQAYRYNGKELDSELLLNTYDYSARYYDPSVGRFSSIDPHAENYFAWSPYVYVGNNPLRLTDPTGMDWYLDEKMGQLYFNKDMTGATTQYNDVEYTRIGGNDMMGDMKDIVEKAYGFSESAELAGEKGYAINPTQQIEDVYTEE